MTVEGFFPNIGLSISVFVPIIQGGAYIGELTDRVSSWKHDIDSGMGYRLASFGMTLITGEVDEWYHNGLGRHIVVYNQAHIPIFEGFINVITLNYAGEITKIGPLMEISNRVSVEYTPVDYTVYPPVRGATTTTEIAEDLVSQTLYGILETVLSAGDATAEDAEQCRDSFLVENAYPNITGELNPGQLTIVPQMSVEIAGYGAWLERFIFDAATVGTIDLRTQILAVLAAEPNNILSTDYSLISANALLVPQSEDHNRSGMTVISGLVVLGDAADTRYTFGITAGRKVVYRPVPSTPKYEYRLSEGAISLHDYATLALVQPWDIQVSNWIIFPDLLIGLSPIINLYHDPRAMFIESLSYSAPYGIAFSGSRYSTLAQKLAKLSLGGI